MNYIVKPSSYQGIIKIPASKSDAQRAILAAALADGTSILSNVGKSDDELRMLENIKLLGADVNSIEKGGYSINGGVSFPKELFLNVGESGLAARLLIPMLAVHRGNYIVSGTGTLLSRPMTLFSDVFPLMGVTPKSHSGCLPLSFEGPVKASEFNIDGSKSSQYVSGLLMALPLLPETSRMTVINAVSSPYIQMTLNTLSKFGIVIEYKDLQEFIIPGAQKYIPSDYLIDGDWSSASYWLVASALGAELKIQGLSMSSLQADKKILQAFISAGCSVNYSSEGISIDGTKRHSFSFDANDCPDLFPALAVLASLTLGVSEIKGIGRLRHKESDRAITLKQELSKLGIDVRLENDSMFIVGKKEINGGKVSSNLDHRIAMSMAICGMFSSDPIEILNADAVSKSYPSFWKDLEKVNTNIL